MRVYKSRFAVVTGRKWARDEDRGMSVSVSFPALAGFRYRMEQRSYNLARRHPKVQAAELTLLALADELELQYRELNEAKAQAIQAHWDAELIYNHFTDVVEIIEMYQGSLRTLSAPDPHRGRVKMVVTNFVSQFKDRYE